MGSGGGWITNSISFSFQQHFLFRTQNVISMSEYYSTLIEYVSFDSVE